MKGQKHRKCDGAIVLKDGMHSVTALIQCDVRFVVMILLQLYSTPIPAHNYCGAFARRVKDNETKKLLWKNRRFVGTTEMLWLRIFCRIA